MPKSTTATRKTRKRVRPESLGEAAFHRDAQSIDENGLLFVFERKGLKVQAHTDRHGNLTVHLRADAGQLRALTDRLNRLGIEALIPAVGAHTACIRARDEGKQPKRGRRRRSKGSRP